MFFDRDTSWTERHLLPPGDPRLSAGLATVPVALANAVYRTRAGLPGLPLAAWPTGIVASSAPALLKSDRDAALVAGLGSLPAIGLLARAVHAGNRPLATTRAISAASPALVLAARHALGRLAGKEKSSALKKDVKLQPQQKRVEEESAKGPLRKLLVHGLGSGKSLSAIAAAEAGGDPYTAAVPAALRQNFLKEIQRHTNQKLPVDVVSHTAMAGGRIPKHPKTLIVDEVGRLTNPNAARTLAIGEAARNAKRLVLLSGTPIVNRPSDLAPIVNMLSGTDFTPKSFTKQFVGERPVYPSLARRLLLWPQGTEPVVKNPDQLRSLLAGKVDWHAPEQPVVPTEYEDVPVEMGAEQSRLYEAMWDRLPWHLRWKLKNDVDLSAEDLKRFRPFLTGPRQVGLSILPYARDKDPLKSFNQSTKLRTAVTRLKDQLKDPRKKALVFSNFIGASLDPYAAALTKAKVPHAVFHGGLSDDERKKLVDDYNANRLRVALIAPSGTEGLSFSGTQLVQQLDQNWADARSRQAIGRALRYGSHTGLPKELQKLKVERFLSRLPLSFTDRMLTRVGFDRSHKQLAADDALRSIADRKEKLNQRFIDFLREVGTPPPTN